MKRFIVVTLCVLLIQGMNLSAGGAKQASEDDYVIKVGIGITAGLCTAPFFIASEKGFYGEEGLKYEEIKIDVNQTHQLLTTGQIDVTNFLLAGMIQPLSNGLDVKIPLGLHTGCIKVLADPDSDIRTAEDLRGKRIGVSGLGAPPTLITQRYLARLGINVGADGGEVEWVIFSPGDLPLALERKQVDAIALNDPAAWIVEQDGKGRVIINTTSDDYLKDEICCVVEASSRVYKNHPETLAKFVRALQKATRYVQENPEETARLMAEKNYVAGDPGVNAQVLKTYTYRASVSGAREAILRNSRDLQQIGIVDQSIDVNVLTDSVFAALPGVPDSL
ncbi:MAG: ABC transporter substrate-binding protein [Treponema sp.]|jgi:NitT/TauT family transport system substrate-binding protein|nr:ABC transporter substrate-binding protein [Treponema sp.]